MMLKSAIVVTLLVMLTSRKTAAAGGVDGGHPFLPTALSSLWGALRGGWSSFFGGDDGSSWRVQKNRDGTAGRGNAAEISSPLSRADSGNLPTSNDEDERDIYAADESPFLESDPGNAEEGRYLNFNIRPALQLSDLPAKAAVVNFTTPAATVDSLIKGTLYLYQASVFSDLVVRGLITGLNPLETFNIHVRQRGDVTQRCNNQGNYYNANAIPTGGYLVRSFTSSAAGEAAISTTVYGIEANLWGPGLLSIIRRSARISLGALNPNSTALACGLIAAAGVGPNTINTA